MSYRRQRVAHDLQRRLAEILAKRVSDPRLAGARVTGVEPAADFSTARVFVRGFANPSEALEALDKAGPYIRRLLGEGLSLRRVPELDFRIDTSLERGERVEEILRELQAEPADREDSGEPS